MDVKAAYSAYLTEAGNPLLTKVAAADIVPRRLPSGFKNQRPAIVWFRHGGSPDEWLDIDSLLITHRCYGGSPTEAAVEGVADALVARIHRRFSMGAGSGRLVSGQVIARMDWSDPDLEHCPVVVVMAELRID